MRKLRHGQKRYEPRLPRTYFPIRAEHPLPLMPNGAAPEKLFDVCERPKRGDEDDPVLRKRSINSSGGLATKLRIEIDQREIRHAVDDHIRYGECVIGIEGDDPDVPADSGCRDDDVFAWI